LAKGIFDFTEVLTAEKANKTTKLPALPVPDSARGLARSQRNTTSQPGLRSSAKLSTERVDPNKRTLHAGNLTPVSSGVLRAKLMERIHKELEE